MDFETEEQQLEAIKKWWKENGNMVIAGIVLGLIVIFGWRYYVDYQINKRHTASVMYQDLLSAATSEGDLDKQQRVVNKLLGEYQSTPYADLSALVLAREQAQKGETVQAIQQLEWVIKNSQRAGIQHIARVRMIRLLFAAGEYEQALQLASIDYPDSFAAIYEELKGDLYTRTGQLDLARNAYDAALSRTTAQANPWLKAKRDDLGYPDKVEPSA